MRGRLRYAGFGVLVVCATSCVFGSDDDIATDSYAATVPTGFIEEQVAGGLSSPTAMQFAPDGRLFVAQQGGALRVIKNGSLLSTPFLRVTVDSSGERGLLGVAFDPDFASNSFVYVYYTATTPNVHNRLSRFTASGDVAVAGSETILLELNGLSGATNHNGGALQFGRDGKLYIAVGDNANGGNAQTLANLLGKMLRLNKDGSIPTDNPFYGSASGVNRAIWAMGLRNPFTFAVDSTSGRIFINDVGQSSWEEVDEGRAGANYGWPNTEGATSDSRFVGPLYTYPHGGASVSGCSIAGGAFYSPQSRVFPSEYGGDYFFADYCSGWIQRIDLDSGNTVRQFATGYNAPVDLKVGSDGALYVLARGSSAVYRIRYTSAGAPTITMHPLNQSVAAGQPASFTCGASGTAPLAYQWQRNSANIAGATSPTYSLTTSATDNGAQFRCIVSNAAGTATSNAATLTVRTGTAPTASITTPTMGTTYAAGTTIQYAGTASDAEDGTLPANAFTWRVDFHHAEHVHPFLPATSGATSGSIVIPTTGHTESNVWYRIHLQVRDSDGMTFETTRDITPRTVQLSFATVPAGLGITVDGQPVTTPSSQTGVVGVRRTLGAPSQVVGGVTYEFEGWSDGGAATHDISTPSSNTTYTARFRSTGVTNGLRGEYFDNINFTSSRVVRIDPTVDFNWGGGAPVSGVGADTFSVRWTGQVQPQFSETYRFYTSSDDGVRLWVNGRLVVDNWTDHGTTENSGTIDLVAGQKYNVQMDFYENGGGAVARLLWSSAGQAKQVIPASRLFPSSSTPLPTPSVVIDSVSTGKTYQIDTAQVGTRLYIDRTYTFTQLSPTLLGGTMIRASNDDKYVAANPHLTFTVNVPMTLYVATDTRATALPSWMNDGTWTLTGETLVATDGAAPTLTRRVHRKDVVAGQVRLGGNAAPGSGVHYVVIARPR